MKSSNVSCEMQRGERREIEQCKLRDMNVTKVII